MSQLADTSANDQPPQQQQQQELPREQEKEQEHGQNAYSVPPLLWDKERDEPYLELEHRGQKYLLTMWRESDGDTMVKNWNHPLVGKWSFKRPYPFTHDHLPSTYDLFLTPDRSPAVLDAYRSGSVHSQPPMETRYILRALRTLEGGKMIGNLDLFPVTEENRWEIAYDLDPEYWGQGLGSMMVGFLVQWAGCTGVKVVSARVSTANGASERIVAKNGFEQRWTQWNAMPEDKGGHMVEFGQWQRTL